MTTVDTCINGMPYVAGIARGQLQPGIAGNLTGKIVLLKQPPTEPFASPPAGFVLVDGAPFSHSHIALLGSGIPGILVTHDQASALHSGMQLLLDGARGLLTSDLAAPVAPDTASLSASQSTTSDGMRVNLRASARGQHDVQAAVTAGASAIGLLRSEFLAPVDGQRPDMAFYSRAFERLAAAGLPLTIRLFDIAASKRPAWLDLPPSATAVLGSQGVRLYTHEAVRCIYQAQLQAINALAADCELRILLPYVADLAELRYWHDDIRGQLDRPVAIGGMAETPAAVLQLGEWLEQVDFAAIGCNDLMQCLFGADRDLTQLRRYLDPHAPALYRFLRQAAQAMPDRLEQVQLCGVLPQLPGILPLLLGLGFRVFSVEAAQLGYLRQVVAGTDTREAGALVERVCQARDSASVRTLLEK